MVGLVVALLPERGHSPSKARTADTPISASGLESGSVQSRQVEVAKPEALGGPKLVAERWLDERHLVLVLDTSDMRFAALDHLNPGARDLRRSWLSSRNGGKPDWHARSRLMKAGEDFAEAIHRQSGEADLQLGAAWTIQGNGGTLIEVRSAPASIGARDEGEGLGRIAYVLCVYLSFSEPAVEPIEVRHASGFTHVAVFDSDRTVSWAIKVNQVGFRPEDRKKVARMGAWIPGSGPIDLPARAFEVVEAGTGDVVFRGTPHLVDDASRCPVLPGKETDGPRPLLTGERVYELDFSACRRPGDYRLRVAGVGVSWPFRIADDAYDEAFVTAARGLLHQRSSYALTPGITAWQRPRYHAEPFFRGRYLAFGPGTLPWPKGYERFDVIAAERGDLGLVTETDGGWYDAADYDRNYASLVVVLDLLWAFERKRERFPDGQLSFAESGNGIPDLLDEVEYGLRVWLQVQDAAGGIPGMLETTTHPAINDTRVQWFLSRPTTWSTLLFAGSAAKFARLVEPYDQDLSERYRLAAERAFRAADTLAIGQVTLPALKSRGRGAPYEVEWTEPKGAALPYRIFAATQLFREDHSRLLRELDNLAACPPPYRWPCTFRDFSPYLYRDLLDLPRGILTEQDAGMITEWFCGPAREILALVGDQPYGQTWPKQQDYWMAWGETIFANRNRALWLAQDLFEDEAVKRSVEDAIVANMSHDFGCNPLGLSWTTGIGSAYPVAIQHDWSRDDGISDPMPGITIYGVSGGGIGPLLDGGPHRFAWQGSDLADGEVPVFRRWWAHPNLNTVSCEFTIHETMAATILSCAMLQSGSTPPPPIPRTELPGRYYLP